MTIQNTRIVSLKKEFKNNRHKNNYYRKVARNKKIGEYRASLKRGVDANRIEALSNLRRSLLNGLITKEEYISKTLKIF